MVSRDGQAPLQMTLLPSCERNEVSVDFCGPLQSGDYLFVVMDDYSHYPEIEVVKSTSAKAVMGKMDSIFAKHGIPEVVKTDNGPPLNGEIFARWLENIGSKHRKITQHWPQANGEVEKLMKSIGKIV